ncbi:hypothetical protein [Leucobacter soli]|uniref:Uncharacterized protein n=1 Tax=Leucobacter soli TaxID=2812850 RepID=A0A916JVH1_9MICO|nr:hypothetical protein LEUCIP111803_00667 [Leucobacter soli]
MGPTARPSALASILSALAALALVLGAVGCADGPGGDASAATDALTSEDQRAIAELTEIAPRDTGVEAQIADLVESVECWQPSANLVEERTFRVICRVHFFGADEVRYRDVICIGELDRTPVADHCYPWAYYTDMPSFEDRPAYTV